MLAKHITRILVIRLRALIVVVIGLGLVFAGLRATPVPIKNIIRQKTGPKRWQNHHS